MSNYTKLKTNLKLAIQRLKLLEKKKTELSLKSRKEIADYLAINKSDRARIRVEHIIREDNYVEAMEMLEMFCDLLLARFGLIEKMKELDPGLDEAIATVIWASPRISNDVQEFKIIGDIFGQKYGKKYAESCKVDALNNVNEKVKKRLGLEAPSKLLVEQYLIEIAKNFNIAYVPDEQVMLRSGQIDEDLINLRDKTNEITQKYGGDNNGNNNNSAGNGGGGGGAAAALPTNLIGFENFEKSDNGLKDLINLDDNNNDVSNFHMSNDGMINYNHSSNNNTGQLLPPQLPSTLPYGDKHFSKQPSPPPYYNNNGASNNIDNNNNNMTSLPPYDHHPDPIKTMPNDEFNPHNVNAPPLPSKNPLSDDESNVPVSGGPPRYDQNQNPNFNNNPVNFRAPLPPSNKSNYNNDDDLGLPSVPTDDNLNFQPSSGANRNNFDSPSLDFDDLAKRFQNLKSKK